MSCIVDDMSTAEFSLTRSTGLGPCQTVERPGRAHDGLEEIPSTLDAIGRGEVWASGDILPLVYDELRKLAAWRLAREKPGQTLDPTALVHEAYLRLAEGPKDVGSPAGPAWANRRHFFAAASEAMRRILVENARRKGRTKHGGNLRREFAELDAQPTSEYPDEILSLHEALERFADHEPVKAKLVELRFFGGLTLEESAACLEISLSTADRAWRYARAWLYAAMNDDADA